MILIHQKLSTKASTITIYYPERKDCIQKLVLLKTLRTLNTPHLVSVLLADVDHVIDDHEVANLVGK